MYKWRYETGNEWVTYSEKLTARGPGEVAEAGFEEWDDEDKHMRDAREPDKLLDACLPVGGVVIRWLKQQ